MANPSCRRFYISGKVQGVWFRASTKEQAIKYKLQGYAKNLADGRVEVVACGQFHELEELEAWLWQGPENSRVDDVDIEAIHFREFEGFSTG